MLTHLYCEAGVVRTEELVLREELIILTAAELGLETTPATGFPELRRVDAWIRYLLEAFRIQAYLISYIRTA